MGLVSSDLSGDGFMAGKGSGFSAFPTSQVASSCGLWKRSTHPRPGDTVTHVSKSSAICGKPLVHPVPGVRWGSQVA